MKKNQIEKSEEVNAIIQTDTTMPKKTFDLVLLDDYLNRKELSQAGSYWSVLSEMQQTTF
jgi:hypothetical protein